MQHLRLYFGIATCISTWLLTTPVFGVCVATDPPVPCNDLPTLFPVGPIPRALVGWVDLDSRIIVRPRGDDALEIGGLDLVSLSGRLVPVPEEIGPSPFGFFLHNTSKQILSGLLGETWTLTPSGLKSAQYDLAAVVADGGDPCRDLNASLGGGFCTLPGDVNFDGDVTFSDFLTLSENFGNDNSVWPDGDFDWDRRVGFSDFLALGRQLRQQY